MPTGCYVGRHPHADRRGLQPASADALFGGKGLPPYELCLAAKGYRPTSFVRRQRVTALLLYRHPHADRRGLQPASADALFGGKGLPPYQLCLAAKGCRPTFMSASPCRQAEFATCKR